MILHTIRVLVALAVLAMPLRSLAVTINIQEKIFSGLGNCGSHPNPLVTADDCSPSPGSPDPAIETNLGSGVNPNWPNWGIGLLFDLLRMHAFQYSGNPANGDVIDVVQLADFAVGGTGGGSAGPSPGGSVAYPLVLERVISVDGVPLLLPFVQTATLEVGWDADTLTINPAQMDIAVPGGTLTLRLGGFGPISVAGDPPVDQDGQIVFIAAAPEPSTLALALIALAGFGAAQRRKRRT